MSQVKITEMPAAKPLDGSERIPIVQEGQTRGATRTQVIAGLQAALGYVPEDRTNRNARNGYVGLTDNKIDPSVLPELNFGARYPVANRSEMLALSAAKVGDLAVRSDELSLYFLTAEPASVEANWIKMQARPVGVSSIETPGGGKKVGDVRLSPADLYGLSSLILGFLDADDPGAARRELGLGSAALASDTDFALRLHSHATASRDSAGFMSAADKRRLESLVSQSGSLPIGLVCRFPKTYRDLSDDYLPLTASVQKFDVGLWPTLDEALGSIDEPGTPATPGTPGAFAYQTRLQAADAAPNDRFSNAIAVSADGSTLAVAAFLDDNSGGQNAGSVYILTRSGSAWTQQARLQASDAAANDIFGSAVALSADGNTLVVTARDDAHSGRTVAGSAYVFVRSGTAWTQQAKLIAGDAANDDVFGMSATISADGNTVAVGAYLDDNSGGTDAGSAYVFVRSGTAWTQQARLQAGSAASGDRFGFSISISSDGNTLVVGASFADLPNTPDAGSAYVFVRSGTAWTQQARLQASDAAQNDRLGFSVSVSADGNTIASGAYIDTNSGGTSAGSVYVFARSGSAWTQQARLQAGDASAQDNFGNAVVVSANGTTLVVGASYDDNSTGSDAGSIYVFTLANSVWTQQARLQAPDGAASDLFGSTLALSTDGFTLVAGALADDNSGGTDAGSAYVFQATEASPGTPGTPGKPMLNVPARPDDNWLWAIKA